MKLWAFREILDHISSGTRGRNHNAGVPNCMKSRAIDEVSVKRWILIFHCKVIRRIRIMLMELKSRIPVRSLGA